MKQSYLTVTDQFCGAGGSSSGALTAGLEIKLALNHWQLAVETHNSNFPNTMHDCTDISASNPRRYPSTDILVTSPECFPAGTLILTASGLVPIERVKVGDLVLTHRNRWSAVTRVMCRKSKTVLVKGQGHPGIETTAEHPFYVRTQSQVWDNAKRDYNRRVMSDPHWKKAAELTDDKCRWATPVSVASLPIPAVGGRGAEFNNDFWWMIGRWLGDGTLRLRHTKQETRNPKRTRRPFRAWPADCERCGKPALQHKTYTHLAQFYCSTKCRDLSAAPNRRGSSLQICCGHAEVNELEQRLYRTVPTSTKAQSGEYRWSKRNLRTAAVFDCPHNGLVEWILENFGQHAHGKTIPAWALSMPIEWRQSLLTGYVSADGSINQRGTSIQTVSKSLAVGIRLLAESLSYRTSMHCYSQERANRIEGRRVNVRDAWVVKWENNKSEREAFSDGRHAWSLVKSVDSGRNDVDVFNLSVDEDESYVVDGIVVHNCTNHSLAKGKARKYQQQLDLFGKVTIDPAEERSRATMWDVPRFAEYHQYRIIIVENVVDARYWATWDAWLHAMDLLGYDHQVVYFNSMFAHPTPQSRDRMYVVFWRKGNRKPDLEFRPPAYCPKCERNVEGVQSWKKQRWGRYRKQYVYICPQCHVVVEPYYYCAANAIDWTLPAPRIGDRPRPLKEKTLKRIRAGLDKFGRQPVMVDTIHSANGHENTMTWPTTVANRTQIGQATHGLITPPFVADLSHNKSESARCFSVTSDVIPTQTSYQTMAIVTPPYMVELYGQSDVRSVVEPLSTATGAVHHGIVMPPYMIDLRGENAPKGINEALSTVCASGNHHGVVLPFLASYYGTNIPSDITNAVPTVTTVDRHSIVVPPFLLSYYTRESGQGAALAGVTDSLPTQPTWPVHYLVQPGGVPAVEDCGFRMLQPHEIQKAMAFKDDYIVLGNAREKVKQLGNAVTPPVMAMIIKRCVESLEG